MPGDVLLVYGDAFQRYRLSEDHPLQPLRLQLTVDLIRDTGLVEFCELAPPREATPEELQLVHSPEYVALVRRLSDPELRAQVPVRQARQAGFATPDNPIQDNPIADGMHEACAIVVGASLMAAEAVHGGRFRHAFNPAGGLHHALPARASGFCVYNDAAVAMEWLRRQGHRVAYVDVDVHHGDGTEAIFRSVPDVLTISLHESGRYLFPGTGEPDDAGGGPGAGTAVNLPFLPYTWDEPWLEGFEAVVPAMLRRFRPTVLVTQDGCDSHLLDPLAHLQTSTRLWPRVGARFHQLAHELCEGRWLALGGGGYAVREVVPRAWTLLFAEMVGRPELAAGLLDPASFVPRPEARERVWASLERDLRTLERVHGVTLPSGAGREGP
ncbi:MAG TPA: acetoin utilization protein AcuC [Candidatus Acidoferrales bacterium]|nr:acetoin utilization protein AcuC [Candidatus Acidoferrales bacterium]